MTYNPAASIDATTLSDLAAEARWTKPTAAVRQVLPRTSTLAGTLTAPVSGQLRMQAVELLAGDVVTSITFLAGSTALAGGSNQWFALYDGNRAKLAVTSDDTSTAWAASTFKTLTLTSPYTAPATGLYYLGLCVVATTTPTVTGVSVSSNVVNLAPILCGNSSSTGLTNPASAPATAGSLTALAHLMYGTVQ